jgi:simple sugar transport system ATP-binding protein
VNVETSTMRAAVRVAGVSKTFSGVRALSDVSFELTRGSSLALLGRNGAGKSTLISILTGLQEPDGGTIEFTEGSAGSEAVGCVYQKSTLIGGITAAENIALRRYPRTTIGVIDWRRMERDGAAILEEWGCGHIADRLVDSLDPVERKIVEICTVLARDPQVLLLDEPTAGLDYSGAQKLFRTIERSRARGVSIIYVSHHLEEIFEVCDTTVVLRDGRVVLDVPLEGLGVGELVAAMVGDVAATTAIQHPSEILDGEPVLEVAGYSMPYSFENVTFDVHPGECVGLAGLDGAGHIEVAEAIAGLTAATDGTLTLRGHTVTGKNVRSRLQAGISFVPEDRHLGGYIPALSVAENATLPVLGSIANRLRLVNPRVRNEMYEDLAKDWTIKAWGPGQPVEELSGGNQQKVVLARAMSSDPDVLVLMNPTAGVDVAAKSSIYATVKSNAERGKAIVVASSDDEDFSICHRVIVMFRGRVHQTLTTPFTDAQLANAIQGEKP